jgi:hypothetical protein
MKVVRVKVRELVYHYHEIVLEVPDQVGLTDERLGRFAEEHFRDHQDLFDCTDSEAVDFECIDVEPLSGSEAEQVQERRKHDENSITSSCALRRWHEKTPLVQPFDGGAVTGYVGDGKRGVHYAVKLIDTFWYATAHVYSLGRIEVLFADQEFSNELQAVDHCQDEACSWCGAHGVSVTPEGGL